LTADGSEFQRGRDAGTVAEKLAQHDRHFTAINGSIERLGNEMHQMNLTMQAIRDEARSRDSTTLATAEALKDADDAQRDIAARKWANFQKVFAAAAGLASVITVISIFLTLFH
jgi:hypothetical protein